MTGPTITFLFTELGEIHRLDQYRSAVFILWFSATARCPSLAIHEHWLALGRAIVTGRPFVDKFFGRRMSWDLSHENLVSDLDYLVAFIEEQDGMDLHISWPDDVDTEFHTGDGSSMILSALRHSLKDCIALRTGGIRAGEPVGRNTVLGWSDETIVKWLDDQREVQ